MRFPKVSALAVVATALFALSSPPAGACGRDNCGAAEGWVQDRDVRHWVYYPRYRHVYYTFGQADPFAYEYYPSGYYPYYNSAYWKPRREVKLRRARFAHPQYYPAWGAHRKHYDHVEWHVRHHGGHRLGDW